MLALPSLAFSLYYITLHPLFKFLMCIGVEIGPDSFFFFFLIGYRLCYFLIQWEINFVCNLWLSATQKILDTVKIKYKIFKMLIVWFNKIFVILY